jgi:hypothetical protein
MFLSKSRDHHDDTHHSHNTIWVNKNSMTFSEDLGQALQVVVQQAVVFDGINFSQLHDWSHDFSQVQVTIENAHNNSFFAKFNCASVKESLLDALIALTDLSLQQSLLWQALCPQSVLGAIFYTQTGIAKPSLKSGSLNIICFLLLQNIERLGQLVTMNGLTENRLKLVMEKSAQYAHPALDRFLQSPYTEILKVFNQFCEARAAGFKLPSPFFIQNNHLKVCSINYHDCDLAKEWVSGAKKQ